jgi:menaquinone-9 beta-reductase
MTALVIGGGPAGAALATRLAQAGREVLLLERDTGPADKVCGEFLSREACLYLTALGVDVRALGAVPIEGLRLCIGAQVAAVDLPFPALSLSRRVLDEALLKQAIAAGATVRRGAKVRELTRGAGSGASSGAGWTARLDDEVVEADDAFLATGKHDLRGYARPPGHQNDLIAFKLHWNLSAEQSAQLTGHVELVLFDGGYAGLQPVDGGSANLCLLVSRRRYIALGRRWPALLAAIRAESAHLAERLDGGAPCWARPLALGSIPYGHLQRRADGPWRLGDQAAVIPSFSGDGMAIALHSAELAAATYLTGASVETYQHRLLLDLTAQVLLASALSRGLVCRPSQVILGTAARLWPGLLSRVATHTRVSEAALRRTGVGTRP